MVAIPTGSDVAVRAFQYFGGDLAAKDERYLELGLVDTVVMAIAERLQVTGIATLDRRHFGAVALRGAPSLLRE